MNTSLSLGGALGGVGGLLSKATQYLPQRITRSFIPGINEDTARYAVSKGLGAPSKMLEESNSSISTLGKSLGSVLSHPKYADVRVGINDLMPEVAKQFPNAGIDATSLGSKLMSVAPNQKSLIEKLVSGEGLTLDELHTLNSEVGGNTFKSVFDDPTVKAGKAIASSFYHSASDAIKSKAPETTDLFSQLSKEYPLNAALKKAVRSGQKARMLTLRDLVAGVSGLGLGGPMGGLIGIGAEKAMVNPTVNLKAAGLINRLGQSNIPRAAGLMGNIITSRTAGQSAVH